MDGKYLGLGDHIDIYFILCEGYYIHEQKLVSNSKLWLQFWGVGRGSGNMSGRDDIGEDPEDRDKKSYFVCFTFLTLPFCKKLSCLYFLYALHCIQETKYV